ncbi:MAG: acyl-ACP--UDP-N-acetylglucosamine O-acyltransferase [Chromatiales bacterium]|nr:acyl-ACP--UDP-N-acetylglucosamine O-acyltransferase [Chromatiales bacterium]
MIDPRAVIDPAAELDTEVEVGPFAIIGPGVQIAAGARIGPHAVLKGPTTIGPRTHVYQFASVGEAPQDKKYAGEPTRLEIGADNVIREFATLHRGTAQDSGLTRVGDRNLLMAYTHVAHDCIIGNDTILANAASMAGHVAIGDFAILGGFTIVHQFACIGAHAFCQMGSVVTRDVPPYVLVGGHPAEPHGINSEGLRRRGFSDDATQRLRRAYKLLYKSGLRVTEALVEMEGPQVICPEVEHLRSFVRDSRRGILR